MDYPHTMTKSPGVFAIELVPREGTFGTPVSSQYQSSSSSPSEEEVKAPPQAAVPQKKGRPNVSKITPSVASKRKD